MPSQKPRLALTLEGDLQVAINDLAEALGKPASRVVVELLTEMVPQLQGLAKMTRAAKAGNKAAVKRALVHMVGDNMAAMMEATQPDMFPKKKKT